MNLDAHQHFWRYDPVQYPWVPPQSALARDWLPRDLVALQQPLGLDGSIAVQARQSLAESDWLLGLADADDRIQGVVGWVDLQSEAVEADLARLARHPKFVGVRHVVQDEPDDRFLLRPEFLRGVKALKHFRLTYDILIYPKQLPAAIEFVQYFPEQPFVLDHIAKPLIRAGLLSPWDQQIRDLARFPNVMCKLSGMVTEADHQHWKPDDFRRYLDVVVDAFGPQRLMWGSDWPVCLLAGSYEQVWRLVDDYIAGWSVEDRQALFGGNCARFYLSRQ
ncbi:MAG TPA: amidohydrolase family protein [Planctomycetaceae bacterium]|nr:amidohydrolase family protein [Planctomycetaceae bacterium]